MALDPNHWTSKVQAAWKSATELAADEGHAETHVIHLAVALFEDPDGLARQVRHVFPSLVLGV
jgi:ATP-dependent Clp protease ATP-binding subunit ClpA